MSDKDGGESASWQQDPFGRHDQRWWNGDGWTERVRSGGVDGIDTPGVDANPASLSAGDRVRPITDATGPVVLSPQHLPRVLLLAVIVLVGIVLLVVAALLT